MLEDRISAHRFRWLAGMLAAVIGLLLWQNWQMRVELRRLNNHVEEAVATAEDASEYARMARDEAVNAHEAVNSQAVHWPPVMHSQQIFWPRQPNR